MRKILVWIIEVPEYGFLSIAEAAVWVANLFVALGQFVEGK